MESAVIDSTHMRVQGNWIDLWWRKVPHKIKVFVWRTHEKLVQQGVNCLAATGFDRNTDQSFAIWFSC
ncbi:hypothetical protein TSUD_347070 [Trifolium subterraneum]|nr:hypothetical protein TSUD_347070 [Trifolium subterraneum]